MTLHIKLHTFPMHLQSSSMYSDTLHIRLCMLHNSTPPPASAPLHVLPLLVCLFVCLPLSPVHVLLVCLFVSPYGLFPLIDGQWTSAKSNCTLSWDALWVDPVCSDDRYCPPIPPLFQSDPLCLFDGYYFFLFP